MTLFNKFFAKLRLTEISFTKCCMGVVVLVACMYIK